MTRTIPTLAAWLALNSAVLAGLFWLFLTTPESNALTVAASAALAAAMLVVAAVTVNAAVLVARGRALAPSITAGLRGVPWFIVAAFLALVAWLLVVQADGWIDRHSGEISAWFIARFGWADVTPLFRLQQGVSLWIRWVAVPLAALGLLAALLHAGARSLTRVQWLWHAWHWRRLALASLVVVMLFLGPWQLTAWRPALPATWIEPAVALVRLGAVAVLALIGSALLVSLAVREMAIDRTGGAHDG